MSLGEAFPALAFRFFHTTLKKNSFAPYFSFHAGSLERFFPLPCFSESLLPKASFFLAFSFPEAPLPRFLLLFSPICSPHAPLKKLPGNVFADCGGLFPSAREKRESFCAKRRSPPKLRLFICFRFSLNGNFSSRTKIRPLRFRSAIRRAPLRPPFLGLSGCIFKKFASPIFYIRDAFAARLRHRSTPRRPFFPAFSQLPPPLP